MRGRFYLAAAVALAPLAATAAPACPSAWMPMLRGAEWTYRNTAGERVTLQVSGADSRNGFVIATIDTLAPVAAGEKSEGTGEPVLQTTFLCTADGLDLPFGEAVTAGRMRIETMKQEGTTLPTPAKLVPGATWTSSRTLRITAGDHISRSRIASTHTAGGMEKVETPAGTFDAMRIDVELSVTSIVDSPRSTSVAGSLLPTKGSSHQWFAKGVGLVKMTTEVSPVPGGGPGLPGASLELVHVSGTKR